MHYELFFWGMLAVVVSALVGGIALGWMGSIRSTLVGALAVSACIAATVAWVHSRSGLDDGLALSAVASFMFAFVISVAFALLTRRILLRADVA